MAESITQVLGVRAAVPGTVDPGGVCFDPEVLRLRLAQVWAAQQEKLDHFGFTTRESAQSACGCGEFVFQRHGLSAFFVMVRATGQMKRKAA